MSKRQIPADFDEREEIQRIKLEPMVKIEAITLEEAKTKIEPTEPVDQDPPLEEVKAEYERKIASLQAEVRTQKHQLRKMSGKLIREMARTNDLQDRLTHERHARNAAEEEASVLKLALMREISSHVDQTAEHHTLSTRNKSQAAKTENLENKVTELKGLTDNMEIEYQAWGAGLQEDYRKLEEVVRELVANNAEQKRLRGVQVEKVCDILKDLV